MAETDTKKQTQQTDKADIIEDYGDLVIDDAHNPDVADWVREKRAKFLILSEEAEKSVEETWGRLCEFMFDDGTKNKKNVWKLALPNSFLETVDFKRCPLTSFSRQKDGNQWYTEMIKAVVSKQNKLEALQKEAAGHHQIVGGSCLSNLLCCRKKESQQAKDAQSQKETEHELWKLLSLKNDIEEPITEPPATADKKEMQTGESSPGGELARSSFVHGEAKAMEKALGKRSSTEYCRRLEEVLRVLSEVIGGRDGWVDVGDGKAEGLRLFLQLGLFAQWKAREVSSKKLPVVLAIRVLEEERLEVAETPEFRLKQAREDEEAIRKQLEGAEGLKAKETQAEQDVINKQTEMEKLKPGQTGQTVQLPTQTTQTDLGQVDAPKKQPSAEVAATSNEVQPSSSDEPYQKLKNELAVLQAKHETAKNALNTAEREAASIKATVTSLEAEVNYVKAEKDYKDKLAELKCEMDKKSTENDGKIFDLQQQALGLKKDLEEKEKAKISVTKSADLSSVVFTGKSLHPTKKVDQLHPKMLPCITHIIFVRSNSMMLEMRKKLRKLGQPIFLLANGTDDAYYRILSEARFSTQFLIFDKTGGASQEIAWDVQCRTSEKLQMDNPSASLCDVMISGDEYPLGSFKVVDPLQALSKSRRFFEETLQAVEDFDDADAESGSIEKKRIQYVWEQIAAFRSNGHAFRLLGRFLQFIIVFLAFLTTTTSIANTQCTATQLEYMAAGENNAFMPADNTTLWEKCCGLTEGWQGNRTWESITADGMVALYGQLTILLPLVASVMFAVMSKLNPTEKFAHLESAATALQSEIYMYRTRVDRYSKQIPTTTVKEKLDAASGKQTKVDKESGGSRRMVFAAAVKRILEDALSSDMRNDFLTLPRAEEKQWTVQLYDPDKERNAVSKPSCLWRWFCCCCSCFSKSNSPKSMGLGQPLFHNEKTKDELWPLRLREERPVTDGMDEKVQELWEGAGTDYSFNEDSLDGELAVFKDDGVSELQVDQYVEARLLPMLREYNKRARNLGRLVKASQVFMTLLTGATTLLASLQGVDLKFLVPAMVALNALVAQCSEYERFPTRLTNVRKSIEELTNIQIWWGGLTMTEQRQKANYFKLITKTEQQADAEIAAWKKSASIDSQGGDEQEKQKQDEKK